MVLEVLNYFYVDLFFCFFFLQKPLRGLITYDRLVKGFFKSRNQVE